MHCMCFYSKSHLEMFKKICIASARMRIGFERIKIKTNQGSTPGNTLTSVEIFFFK
jgi:hypothetical protein